MNRHNAPPEDRFCDLVMKGGVTSGIVYPRAIALLSRHYRFKSIGGTSAGAIAAAITAAAEYQRRETGSCQGFDLLEELPDELAKEVGSEKRKLFCLFQPQPGTRRLFAVLANALNQKGTNKRILAVMTGLLFAYWPAFAAPLLSAVILSWAGYGFVAVIVACVSTLIMAIAAWVYHDVSRNLVENGFGMCSGMTEDKNNVALTPWLHDLIQRAAGRSVADPPLTFGELWDAKGYPPAWLKETDPSARRSIDLQMFSTNLAHGRPYIFPLSQTGAHSKTFRSRERLFFKNDELIRLFPPEVVIWMLRKTVPYQIEPGREGKDPSEEAGRGLRELPESRDLPVVLAARMSLAFPFLLTAVPLHAINHESKDTRVFERCWFSDGGISSNFPMHLFDSLVPIWPTFGIQLEAAIPTRGQVYLPQQYAEGYGERWNRFDSREKAVSRLGGFIGAIAGTMQNWNDTSLSRMPGVRDRVARVRLFENEGGLNLNMECGEMRAIAERGVKATEELIKRFATIRPDGRQAIGWDEHRFIRINLLIKMIEARLPAVSAALDVKCKHVTPAKQLIDTLTAECSCFQTNAPPPGYERTMTAQEVRHLNAVIQSLVRAADAENARRKISFTAIPMPELRVRPPL